MPKISILVPVYNVEKYLKECLDSIINQTIKDIEIICINDGSTDNCHKILEEYGQKDNRIKIINKQNSGYGDSMNKGMELATGEYIGIIESDDFVDNNMFEELYKIAKEKDCEIVKSDWYQYWTSNDENRKMGKISAFKAGKITNVSKDKSLLRITPSIWSAIYKREFLTNNDIKFLPTPGASYQDTSFTLKTFMCAKRIMLTKNAYVHYRQDNINSSVKSKGKIYALCHEYEETEKFINANENLNEFKEYVFALEYKAYLWTLQRIDKSFKDEFINAFSERFKKINEQNVIGNYFFKKINKKQFNALITNTEDFKKAEKERFEKNLRHSERAKNFSVRINSSRISIILFGKQIIKTK